MSYDLIKTRLIYSLGSGVSRYSNGNHLMETVLSLNMLPIRFSVTPILRLTTETFNKLISRSKESKNFEEYDLNFILIINTYQIHYW